MLLLLDGLIGGLQSDMCLEITHEADETDEATDKGRSIEGALGDVVDALPDDAYEKPDGDETKGLVVCAANTPVVGHDKKPNAAGQKQKCQQEANPNIGFMQVEENLLGGVERADLIALPSEE